MTTEAKKRYYTPTARVSISVSLDEFSIDDIEEYLSQQGHIGSAKNQHGGLYVDQQTLDQIFTLDLCGQNTPARDMAPRLIEIGRAHV